mgnify:FL=1
MGQREVILPVTKVFTMASGVTQVIPLEDTTGTSVEATYATLIDLSGGPQNPAGDIGTTSWIRLVPGHFSATNWQYKAWTSGVGYTHGPAAAGGGAGYLFDTGTEPDVGAVSFASSIDSGKAVPGVVGPAGTTLVLTTMVAFDRVTVGNHSEDQKVFALTFGNIKNANSTKDQQQPWGP